MSGNLGDNKVKKRLTRQQKMTSTSYNREVKGWGSNVTADTHLIYHTDHVVSNFTPLMLALFGSV